MAKTVLDFTKAKRIISTPIPESVIFKKPGKGDFSYVTGSTIVDLLNEAFDYRWSWRVESYWIQKSEDKFNKKYDPEPVPQGPVAHVLGTLTVFVPREEGGFFEIQKSGFGSKSIMGGQSDQESIFKSAGTDALKKAASILGVGAQLYRKQEGQEFFDGMNYEDPWSDEALERYKPDRDYIRLVKEQFKMTDAEMDEVVSDLSSGAITSVVDLTPDNISAFVQVLEEQVKTWGVAS